MTPQAAENSLQPVPYREAVGYHSRAVALRAPPEKSDPQFDPTLKGLNKR
jgi:hypothetical protein